MSAIFSKLWPTVAAAYGVQVAAASIFVPLKTEKYYDFMGATGHIVCATVSIYGPSIYKHFKSGGSALAYRFPPLTVSDQQATVVLFLNTSSPSLLGSSSSHLHSVYGLPDLGHFSFTLVLYTSVHSSYS